MMRSLCLGEIAEQTQGQFAADAHFSGVSTDSRAINKGDLFVALSGEKFNGNRFIADVAAAGAAAAVVSEEVVTDLPLLRVADTRLALGAIARINRRQFNGPLVALTGSAGKTTTKELVASILSESGQVMATRGNFNNEIGVPLTLLRLQPEHDYAVVEMGASRAGDIGYLAAFAEPTVSVLTNAMPAHLEGFGDLQTIATTKGEIFSGLNSDGVAVLNFDDQFFSQWQQSCGHCRQLTFSKNNNQADVYASDIHSSPQAQTEFNMHLQGKAIAVSLPLLGEQNVVNALAAGAAALAVGSSIEQIKSGLEKVEPVKGRLKPVRGRHCQIIDDSYNASPNAVKAAIDVLQSFAGSHCLVLGMMSELGADAKSLHAEVADYARDRGVEQLLVIGDYAVMMAERFGDNAHAFQDMGDLLAALDKLITANVVLVKGSRSAAMERVVDSLSVESNRGAQ